MENNKPLAVVVLSGGLDSCVTSAVALDMGYDLGLLHINYGQLTEQREKEAFEKIADYYGIARRLMVDIKYLTDIGGSSLTDKSMDVETGGVNKDILPSTYVPFRNGNILSIAVSWCEVIGASDIFIGAVEGDSSGYPDCTQIFYDKFNEMLAVALSKDRAVKVSAPLIHMTKAEIVKKGTELSAPLDLTWSCYQNEILACGVCDSCRLRRKGFEDAGVEDAVIYEID